MVTTFGAVTGLIIAIVLILKKVPPVYGMMLGALCGALLGGANLGESVTLMLDGAKGIMPAVLRILSAGVLSGVLIKSGAAKSIAKTLVESLGETKALFALSIATFVLTCSGVFIDVAVITVAPIALTIASRIKLSRMSTLFAMIGGGKAGNIVSANPNAIAASEAFEIPLTSLMIAGIIPAVCGLLVTFIIANKLKNKGDIVSVAKEKEIEKDLPSFGSAILGPIVSICLLALRPLFGINIDPMIALPLGGIAGAIFMGKIKHINEYSIEGLNRMTGVAIMLIGTGTLAGVISNSMLRDTIVNGLASTNLPAFLLAPISGALMSLATASTTAGTTVASNVFGNTILELGVAPLAAAVMIQSGATVLDHMPHGSFFHSTGGSVYMGTKERLKVIPYESLVGLVLATVSTIIYGMFGLFV